MRDSLVLLLTAIVVSGIAWAFWRFTGEDGFTLVLALMLLMCTVDNARLRRRLRQLQPRASTPASSDKTPIHNGGSV